MKLPREFSLGEIAAVSGGRLEGPSDIKIAAVATNPMAAGPGELALVFEPKLVKRLDQCRASAVIVPEGAKTELPKIVVKRPMLALRNILTALQPRRFFPETGIHPSAVVDPTCHLAEGVAVGPLAVIGPGTKIGKGTRISAGCVIGGQVTIGEDCLFHPGCMVADYVQIGNRVILQQGASIGSDGFGYVTERPSNMELRMAGIKELSEEPNPHLKIPQIGTVVVEDDVEIGSNVTIDRATIGATIIGAGTKVDNLVMVAHNCKIGREAIIVSLVGIAGSCTIGDRAILAGHVGVKDHIKIGKDAIVEGKAGVMRDIPDGDVQVGSPAAPAREFFSQVAFLRKAPQFQNELRALKRKVEELEAALKERELVGQSQS